MPVMTLQGSFTSGELSPSLTARVDLAKYQQGCKTLKNMLVQPHGGAVKRPGFSLLDTLPGEAVLIPFVFNSEQTYVLVFGEKWLRVATVSGFILSGTTPYQTVSPYTLAQVKQLSFTQSADVLFLASQGTRPYKLKRLGHASWQFEAMTFTAPISPPGGLSAEFVNTAKDSEGNLSAPQLVIPYTYYVTAVNSDGHESVASSPAAITGPAPNNWQAGDYISVTWGGVSGAEEYRIYKAEFGGRPGYIATAGGATYQDYNAGATLSDGPPKWTDPFPGGDYPGAVCFFEQRLVFASTPKRPQTLWMSRSGDYSNFSASVPLKADDSLELTIASNEVSRMCWMVALRSLVLGSTGMEWEISSSEGAFSTKTAKATPQSYRGSAALRALIIDNTILHVTRSGNEVRDFKYDFGSDSYAGTDRTILAEHLFEGKHIVSWTYQASPDSIVWAVRDDGVLLGMTFQPEHEVFAWHQHHTDGLFVSVCAIPHNYDDVLFTIAKRGNMYSLEKMAPRYLGGDTTACTYLDCSLACTSPTGATEFSGLNHLEGKKVGILANGAVVAAQTVKNGTIRLKEKATAVIVGLPYDADLETMSVEIAGQEGASVGRKKYINAVNVLFKDTITAKVGCSWARLEEYKARTTEPYGQGPAPYTGTRRVIVKEHAKNEVTVCVRSDSPLPMTVLAIMPEVEVK